MSVAELPYLLLRGRIMAVQYREDLEPLLTEVATAENITGPQKQDLEVLIDQRRQLPSRPPTAELEGVGAEMPPPPPLLAHHNANYLGNNSNFQIIAGGRRRTQRRRSDRSRRNRTRSRRNSRNIRNRRR
jgi:hypothetical protein